MFSKAFLAKQLEALQEERTRVLSDLLDIATEDPKNPGVYIPEYDESGADSEDDNAGEITDYADRVSLVHNLSEVLRDIDKAIASIESGTYGKCKYCGKLIDEKRLEARATSSACISCKKTLTQEL